jgi:hyaluronan synthase
MVRRFLDHYLAHTVAGRVMPYGDDAMMTRYAMLAGRTVLQVDSWGYTLHPENLNHLTRQRVRWWRSFFWGNLWLLRAFPVTKVIWWMVAWRFVAFAWLTVAVPAVLLVGPTVHGVLPWMFLAWVVGVSYLTNARYLTIRRPGEGFGSHLITWLLAPLSGFLNLYLGFVLQYWGLFTCLKTGWGTRQKVEVGAE